MTNIAVLALRLCIGGMAGWCIHSNRTGIWSSESRVPTILQIHPPAPSTVLHVPVADVQVYTLLGYTGDLVNKALQDARRPIAGAGGQPDLIEQARSRTKEVITRFFGALGWQVETRWLDRRAATPVASPTGPAS